MKNSARFAVEIRPLGLFPAEIDPKKYNLVAISF
jgi:hypothetical protein